jgi:hypothetical protein
MTTWWLLKPKTLFRAKSGKGIKISDKGNAVSRTAYIKHSKDNVLLSKRKGSHNDDS